MSGRFISDEANKRAMKADADWLSREQSSDIRPHDILDSPLRRWWTDSAFDEADRTIAKCEEYGSTDLVAIGERLWRMCGRTSPMRPEHAMELGCLFYIFGKIERAMSAVQADRPISDDTWFDIHIYAKMAQAARQGVWPL